VVKTTMVSASWKVSIQTTTIPAYHGKTARLAKNGRNTQSSRLQLYQLDSPSMAANGTRTRNAGRNITTLSPNKISRRKEKAKTKKHVSLIPQSA